MASLPSLPDDVERHVFGILASLEARQVVHDLRSKMHAFTGEGRRIEGEFALRKTRDVYKPLPPLLIPLYESYSDTTYFTHVHLVFFSEKVARQKETLVDFATEYTGMGHYIIHTYDSSTGKVLSCVGGGGGARTQNVNERQVFLSSYLAKKVQPHSSGPSSVHDSFEAWWMTRASALDSRAL